MIQKVPGKRLWRVVSHHKDAQGHRKNLGTSSSLASAKRRLAQVEWFKAHKGAKR